MTGIFYIRKNIVVAVVCRKRTNLAIARVNLSKVQKLGLTGAMRTCLTAAIEVVLSLTLLYI